MTEHTPTPYQPSNGTEGYAFIDKWCGNCERDKCQNGSIPMNECRDDDFCEILGRTMMCSISDQNYPKEWIRDESGSRCTAFVNVGEQVPVRDMQTIDMFGELQGEAV